MHPFDQDGMIVLVEVGGEFSAGTGGNNIGELKRKTFKAGLSFINMYTGAILVQFGGITPLIIGKIMEVNLYPGLTECPDPVKHINSTPVISGPWSIQANDM